MGLWHSCSPFLEIVSQIVDYLRKLFEVIHDDRSSSWRKVDVVINRVRFVPRNAERCLSRVSLASSDSNLRSAT